MVNGFWAVVGKVAKKIVMWLLGDKKGRKFLGYVIGIALFTVLLPFIAVYGLFGWMGGTANDMINSDMVYEYMAPEHQEMLRQYEDELTEIETVFTENGLSDTDISQAKTIYLSCLTGKENEDGFYQKLADCFLNRTEESDALTNISSAFGVTFTDADRNKFNEIYGGT